MSDFTRSFETVVDAPVHDVFEYCLDPRHLFQGWSALEVTDVVVAPGGVGTTAHIEGRFFGGRMVEQIEREYAEVVPDERIVTRAHAEVRFLGRTREVANGPVFTWQLEAVDGGTRLTLVVLEEDLHWWERLGEAVTARFMGRNMDAMLAAVKAGVEGRASAA